MSSIWMVVIKYQSNLTLYHNSLSWLQYTELKTRRTLRLLYNYQASWFIHSKPSPCLKEMKQVGKRYKIKLDLLALGARHYFKVLANLIIPPLLIQLSLYLKYAGQQKNKNSFYRSRQSKSG